MRPFVFGSRFPARLTFAATLATLTAGCYGNPKIGGHDAGNDGEANGGIGGSGGSAGSTAVEGSAEPWGPAGRQEARTVAAPAGSERPVDQRGARTAAETVEAAEPSAQQETPAPDSEETQARAARRMPAERRGAMRAAVQGGLPPAEAVALPDAADRAGLRAMAVAEEEPLDPAVEAGKGAEDRPAMASAVVEGRAGSPNAPSHARAALIVTTALARVE